MNPHPALDSLACVNPRCKHHGLKAHGNLYVRKIYGPHDTLYLRCRSCGDEFSERKNTPLWNAKIAEDDFVGTVEQLSEGTSIKGTARLLRLTPETVRRIALKTGQHARALHNERAVKLSMTALQADERHGFVGTKSQQAWDATVIDPASKFLVQAEVGRRDAVLGRRLLLGARQRLANPHDLVLFTDGWAVYEALFPEVFGVPYRPARQGTRGRFPKVRHRIPRTLAHVLTVKRREGRRVVEVLTQLAHGTWSRVTAEVTKLGYTQPNTSAVERQNATARRMNAHQARRRLAFARTSIIRCALSDLTMGVYNWCRLHAGLRLKLAEPQGRRRYQQPTPAMAIGLTDRPWLVADLLRLPVFPAAGSSH